MTKLLKICYIDALENAILNTKIGPKLTCKILWFNAYVL